MNELHHLFFIVEDDHTPCAYCSIEQKDDFLFNFQKIYAVPTVHGKGIGRYLIEQGIEYIKRNFPAASKVELYVNRFNPAVDFYKHMGFEIESTRDHYIGNDFYMNDFIMVKTI
jgi:ribosomal protein S18 acetylase RimI-like enzyme